MIKKTLEEKKALLKIKNAQYYATHKEEHKEYAREYNLINRDLIREQKMMYYECECGKLVSHGFKAVHNRSQFHQRHLTCMIVMERNG